MTSRVFIDENAHLARFGPSHFEWAAAGGDCTSTILYKLAATNAYFRGLGPLGFDLLLNRDTVTSRVFIDENAHLARFGPSHFEWAAAGDCTSTILYKLAATGLISKGVSPLGFDLLLNRDTVTSRVFIDENAHLAWFGSAISNELQPEATASVCLPLQLPGLCPEWHKSQLILILEIESHIRECFDLNVEGVTGFWVELRQTRNWPR